MDSPQLSDLAANEIGLSEATSSKRMSDPLMRPAPWRVSSSANSIFANISMARGCHNILKLPPGIELKAGG